MSKNKVYKVTDLGVEPVYPENFEEYEELLAGDDPHFSDFETAMMFCLAAICSRLKELENKKD
jgi:hypothetical protein